MTPERGIATSTNLTTLRNVPAGYFVFIAILAVLIYLDARRFDWTGDGFSKAWHWSVGMLIIWPVVLVLYLMRRRKRPRLAATN